MLSDNSTRQFKTIARGKLEFLIRIISELSSVDSWSELIRTLLITAMEFTEAERGFFVKRKSGNTLEFYDSVGKLQEEPEVSLSTVRLVMQKKEALNLVENADGQSIPPTVSILALNLKTIMCAPILLPDQNAEAIGVLYVDSRIVVKPFGRQDLDFFTILADHAAIVWHNLELTQKLKSDYKLLHEEVRAKYDYHKIIGQCEAMKQVYKILEMMKDTDLDVLILGDTGAGKELIAKAIHYSSKRSEKPLTQLNCAALPEGLVEAELFGVERNVATDVSKRTGKMEQAHKGTLFLDEIGDMPLRVQNRLLRFLEDRKFRRIGGRDEITADVRVLAATNKDLDVEIKKGRFRDALRYRLDVVTINLPPLRERGDDLALLAEFFLNQIPLQERRQIMGFTSEAWEMMRSYPWPGNVRELKHRVQSAAFLAKRTLIDIQDLGLEKKPSPKQIQPLAEQLKAFEAKYVLSIMERFSGAMDTASKCLGISEAALKKKLSQIRKKN